MKFEKSMLIGIFIFIQFIFSGCSVADSNQQEPDPKEEPETTEISQVDTVVQNFITTHQIPGLSVAITKDGKLVYAQSYGLSDTENNTDVTNSSLFRVASVSKPITGVAIMKLVEEGKISLEDKVFGEGGILGLKYGENPYSDRLMSITVSHLLHHTSGGWPNDGSDPMFTNPEMSAEDLISWVLDNRTLTHEPGTNFAYSNFGYSVLGRVIEEVSGESYENYVLTELLDPMGINDMHIAGNTVAERRSDEVVYYGQSGENPYIYNISRMDAHGGWIATATDLARFLVHTDGYSSKNDILDSSTTNAMVTGSKANPNYAAGWSVNSANNWWHTGSLPGTSSLLVRTSLGFNWVILCNSRSLDSSFGSDLDQLIWKAINDSNTDWPEEDLF